jgi:hypothetical protein
MTPSLVVFNNQNQGLELVLLIGGSPNVFANLRARMVDRQQFN